MSHKYKAVGWNRQKRRYDTILLSGVALYLVCYVSATMIWHPQATAETILIRAFGTCALLLLHIILCIGPLCRLDARFLPLLYNRRHMGVTMFCLALVHSIFSIVQFHALGNIHPLISLLAGNSRFDSLSQFPFELLGVIALVILFLMAATSHDFWLANLTAPTWKTLHMCVYLAYALLVMHVVLGALQSETSPVLSTLLGLGMMLVIGLHIASALKGVHTDRELMPDGTEQFVDVCAVDEIPESRAKVFTLNGERVAVFRYDGKISAISNVCQHQNGPLGEGCIIGGLVTCPWHGYQYDPATGASPPPFTEKIPTFKVEVSGGRVRVHTMPQRAGTRTDPALIS